MISHLPIVNSTVVDLPSTLINCYHSILVTFDIYHMGTLTPTSRCSSPSRTFTLGVLRVIHYTNGHIDI